MAATFTSTYGDNPWAGITDKTREVFVPDLLDVFRRTTVWQQFVPFKVNLGAEPAEQMTFTTLYDLEPNTDPVGLRDLWLETMQTDSETKSIVMEHHAGKVTLHKYDELVSQWRRGSVRALRAINKNLLGRAMMDHLDILARNAFLDGTWVGYGANMSKSDFNSLDPSGGADDFDPAISDEIFLGMQTRGVSGAVDASGTGTDGMLIAITSPGVIYAIQRNSDWVSRHQYADPSKLLRYEVGTYRNTRYLSHPSTILWNSGSITAQLEIKEPLYAGSGAARNVDKNRVVGQTTLAAGNRYIQFDAAADLSAFNEGDIITIHTVRTSDFGVTNGVDYRSGMNTHRRVVSIDDANKRISVDRPVLKDYTTDLGGTVYGYVTKATTVHATVFLTGPNPVVAGVGQSPRTYAPPPIDDVQAFYRFSWDAYLKYQIWNDHNVEVVFNTGKYRVKGASRY